MTTKREPGTAPLSHRKSAEPSPLDKNLDPRAKAIFDAAHARGLVAANARAKFPGGTGENEVEDDDAIATTGGNPGNAALPSNYGLRNPPPRKG